MKFKKIAAIFTAVSILSNVATVVSAQEQGYKDPTGCYKTNQYQSMCTTQNYMNQFVSIEKIKFPNNKYWNRNINDCNKVSDTPCSKSDHAWEFNSDGTKAIGFDPSYLKTCNLYQIATCLNKNFKVERLEADGYATQCAGFALKLQYDYFGTNNVVKITDLTDYTPQLGDVLRINNDMHSIFITGVYKKTITYADCNSDGHCKISWNHEFDLKDINKLGLTYVYRPLMVGDCNSDGVVDVEDTFILFDHVVDQDIKGGLLFQSCDIDNNGKLELKDLIELRKYVGTMGDQKPNNLLFKYIAYPKKKCN